MADVAATALSKVPNISGSIAMIYLVVIGLVIFGCIGFIVFILAWKKSFNKQVLIRTIINNKCIAIPDRAKLFTDSDGSQHWKRFKEKNKNLKLMPVPPSNAIDTTVKGVEFAEYYLIDGVYLPLVDKREVASVPEDLFSTLPDYVIKEEDVDKRQLAENKWRNDTLNEWKRRNGIKIALQPVTSQHRAIMVNSIRRAEERKGTSWMTMLPNILYVGAFLIIVICLLIFYPNISKPMLESKALTLQIVQSQAETTKALQEMKQDIQTIKADSGLPGTKPAPN